MPYMFEYKKIRLPKECDRRRKLTDIQREEIKEKYASGNYSMYKLANEYNVSRRTIQFTIYQRDLKELERLLKEMLEGVNITTKKKTQ